jgi:phosphoenolpyruvate synthase/pyruvate phosphate dikinase
MMEREFGPPGTYGVFVRSDTNAEDLPEFTGAGLNKTVPNVVGLQRQLAAVPEVWSSVYTPRAMAWRARILDNPEAVFASALLMKSVPSEKSGVLVTADLAGGGEGLTVSVSWGVGGAVDNESAASRVLRPDGGSLLLAEAKAPYQRALAPEGGVSWLPAPMGPVLTEAEMAELRRLAAEVVDRYPPARDSAGSVLPWDIEFAFSGGRLWLLQIRPLVQRGRAQADAVVNERVPGARAAGRVPLDERPDAVVGGGI